MVLKKKNNKEETNRDPHIKFRRKRTKTNIKFFFRFMGFIVICAIIVIIFSDLTIRHRVEKQILKLSENKINEDYVILDYTKIVDKVSPSVVTISDSIENLNDKELDTRNVSGIIIDESGTILTSYLKIKDSKKIYVKVSGKGIKPLEGELIGKDEKTDVAFIKVQPKESLNAVSIATNYNLVEGQGVALMSNSTGSEVSSIYPGIISSISRSEDSNYIEITGAVSDKDIGGVLCNSKGELVGIVTEKINKDNKSGNLSYFALNLSNITDLLKRTEDFNRVLGVEGGLGIKNQNGETQGFYIEKIIQDGAASKAGLKATDIIYELDDLQIKGTKDLSKILANKKIGDKIKCRVLRNGKFKDFTLIIQQQ